MGLSNARCGAEARSDTQACPDARTQSRTEEHAAAVGLGCAPDRPDAPVPAGTSPHPDALARANAAKGDAARTPLHVPSTQRGGNRRAVLATLIVAGLLLILVVVAGRLVWDAACVTDFSAKNLAPSLAHPFGTDQMGRDMLLRTLAGLSTSLFVGALAAAASGVLALAFALIAAFGGRVGDAVVSWLIDFVMSIPHIVLLLLISCALGRGAFGVTVGLMLTHWPSLARVLRAELLQLKSAPWLAATEALGVSRIRIALTHVVPAFVPQLVVGVVLAFPHVILHESSLTFLGFGLSLDEPALGVILAEAMGFLTAGMWWQALLPGAVLAACVLLLDHVGGLLRALSSSHAVQE
ncbi:MAG: ABC transporter permease [Coriobacteriaceae bacterium]|nr:ABC transporter permease [Coriobacteriaceae bacterium]